MYGNRQWAICVVCFVVCFVGLTSQVTGVARAADPLRRILDSLKPRSSTQKTSAIALAAAPSVTGTPTTSVALHENEINRASSINADSHEQAAALWDLPAVQPTHTPTEFDPRTWMPDPSDSPALRMLRQSDESCTQDTMEALATVKYPQASHALDWDPNHQPSAQRYFEALRKARQAAAGQPGQTRITKAHAHTDYGFDLMQRGAVNSAHDEFVEALWSVVYANDATDVYAGHVNQLATALETLDEADQFASLVRVRDNQTEVSRLASRHQSPVARRVVSYKLDALAAMQSYYEVARSNLVEAMDGDGTGAEALYGLARTIQQRANQKMTTSSLAGPRAMALLLAAHQIVPDDHRVSNELGVMYARFGELEKAEKMLKRSLLSQEQAESWHNLSRVWQLAGKDELAGYAQQRADQIGASGAASIASQVGFVAPQDLAAAAPLPSTPSAQPRQVVQAAQLQSASQSGKVEKTSWLKKMFSKRPTNK